MVWFSSLTRKAWTASRARFFIRQKEKPRLETRRRNHARDIMQIDQHMLEVKLDRLTAPIIFSSCKTTPYPPVAAGVTRERERR